MYRRAFVSPLFVVIAVVACPSFLVTRASVATDDEPKRAAKQQSGPRVYKGRVIAPVMTAAGGGAQWLERDDRDATEQPEKVIDSLKIAPGSVVADVGAGTGYFSIRIAKRLGPDGRVLATDVQPEMLRQLREFMAKARVKNVEPILATADDAKLPPDKVDLVLMVDVYHELQDPERTMAQIRKSLKADGRLVLVEYRAEDPSVPILPVHKTTLRQVRYEIEPMGFRLKEVFEFLPHQHVEVFVKDDVAGEDVIVNPSDFPTIRKPGWAGVGTAEPYEASGFQPLFNGRDLAGWTGADSIWQARAGAIFGEIKGSFFGDAGLRSNAKYEDFELDLQWRLTDADGRTGVWIRNNPALLVELHHGVPHAPGYPEIIAKRRTGEVYGPAIIQPTNDTANAVVLPDEWNRLTVRCVGRRIQIAINGVATADFEAGEGELAAPVGFTPVRGRAQFREIRLKPLREQN
jgi:SAM-dependent methyltransferase